MVYHNLSFGDIDALSENVWGWNIDFRLLDRTEFRAEIKQVATDQILISRGRFNSLMEQPGESPPMAWTFGILNELSPDVIWRGQIVSKNALLIYPPGSEIDVASPAGFDVLTVSIPTKIFTEWDSIYQMADRSKVQPLCTAARLEPIRLNAVRSTATHVIYSAENGSDIQPEQAGKLADSLFEALPYAVPNWQTPTMVSKSQMLKEVTNYIDAHIDEPILLKDMCAIGKVNPRTLQRNFKSRFGLRPKKHIRIRRLNGVRHALQKARHQDESVADIANAWGFWHLGQFAFDYRRFFGERPSQTMANSMQK